MPKNAAFIYDHRYIIFENKVYSTGAFTSSTWSRFLKSFRHLTVCGTLLKATSKEEVVGLNLVSREGVSFVHYPYIGSMPNYLKNMVVPESFFKALFKKVDAVIIRVPGEYVNNAFWVAKKMNMPIGLEVVGCPWDAYRNYGNLQGKLIANLAKWRMKRIVKNAPFVVYVTKHFLQYRYPTEGKTINASNVDIDVGKIKQYISKLPKRNSSFFTIGISGSFNVKYKGHKELLLALAEIKDELPPFKIEMIGPGDYSWVEQLAKTLGMHPNLVIKGKLKAGQEVIDWFAGLDLYVHASKQEGLPRSVIEAMACGSPVLASSIAGIPELLKNEFLHAPGDYQTLAKQLKQVVPDKEKLKKMGKENLTNAKAYDTHLLESRRLDFWAKFAKSIPSHEI